MCISGDNPVATTGNDITDGISDKHTKTIIFLFASMESPAQAWHLSRWVGSLCCCNIQQVRKVNIHSARRFNNLRHNSISANNSYVSFYCLKTTARVNHNKQTYKFEMSKNENKILDRVKKKHNALIGYWQLIGSYCYVTDACFRCFHACSLQSWSVVLLEWQKINIKRSKYFFY